jgi:hypothetical protein
MKYVSHCVFIFLFVLSAKACCAEFLHWNCSLSNSAKTKLPIIQKSKVTLFYFNFFIYIFSYWLIKHNCHLERKSANLFSSPNIKTQWETYFMFCIYFHFEPIPATDKNLTPYAQFLSRSFKTVDAIRNYISGV